MSESYEVLVLMPEGLPSTEVVNGTHEVIGQMGGTIDEDCLLILHDTETERPDIEYISNPQIALTTLANWPALGGLNYAMPDGLITVEFAGTFEANIVQAIRITIPDAIIFDEEGEESKERYVTLGKRLHERFRAKRTIVDWGLFYMGIYWKEEINRLKNGEFVGQYFIDLRTTEA
jgi:hypothetical protein